MFLVPLLCIVLLYALIFGGDTGRQSKLPKLPGPSYPSLPVIGQSYLLLCQQEPLKVIEHYSRKYGPLYRFDLGPCPTVVLTTHKLLDEAFKNKAILGRIYNRLPTFHLMMGGQGIQGDLLGFAGSQGENWRQQRSFFVHQMRRHGSDSASSVDTIVGFEAEALVESLKALPMILGLVPAVDKTQSSRGLLTMEHVFMPATVNIIWKLSTGETLNPSDPKIQDIVEKIGDFFKFLQPGPNSYLQLNFPWFMRLCSWLGFKTGLNTYSKMIGLFQTQVSKMSHQPEKADEFITNYLRKAREASPGSSFYGQVGVANLVASLGDIFMGGADTTNNQLEWVFFFTAFYPEVQEKLRKEIISHFGYNETPSLADMSKTPYTEAFLMEVTDTQVLIDLNRVLKDPEIFPEPDEFKPDRFLRGHPPELLHRDILSRNFGAGPRRCPGEKIAKAELFIILVKMLQAFRIFPSEADLRRKSSIFKGYFGLNHVPLLYTVRLDELPDQK